MNPFKTLCLGLLFAALAPLAVAGDGPPPPNRPKAPTNGDRHAVAVSLIEVLQDEDAIVVQYVSNALVCLGRNAVPALIETLDHKDKRVRCRAAEILGRLGTMRQAEGALPALLKTLKDKEVEVRRAAAGAVALLLSATVSPDQRPYPNYAPACYPPSSYAAPPCVPVAPVCP